MYMIRKGGGFARIFYALAMMINGDEPLPVGRKEKGWLASVVELQ